MSGKPLVRWQVNLARRQQQQTEEAATPTAYWWFNLLQKRRMSCHASSAPEDF